MLALPTTTTRGAAADELMVGAMVSIDGRLLRALLAVLVLALTFTADITTDFHFRADIAAQFMRAFGHGCR
jgi:hypothetical protein